MSVRDATTHATASDPGTRPAGAPSPAERGNRRVAAILDLIDRTLAEVGTPLPGTEATAA
jgi:hypothetical protein